MVITRMIVLLITGAFLFVPAHHQPSQTNYHLTKANGATLVGVITVKGQTLAPTEIDMAADPTCMELSRGALTEFVVRNGDKLQNVLLYVKSAEPFAPGSFDDVPATPAVLQHKNCFYIPRVMGIRVDQELRIENNDPIQHNTHAIPKTNPEWNQTQPADAPPLIKKMRSAEPHVPFKCNQHPWERAWVGLFNHPFFTVSDLFGRYEISGIPPGKYQIVAWHETLGQQEIEATLVLGEVRNLDFTFAGNAK